MIRFNKFNMGVMLGVITGLVLAPAPGSVTRARINNAAITLRQRIDELFGKGDSDLDELKHIIQDETREVTADVRRQLLKLVERSKSYYEEARSEM